MASTLANARPGEAFEIRSVPDDQVRARLLRLGFMDGDVTCRQRLRKGPVVIRRNGTDLAVGATVAEDIEIA